MAKKSYGAEEARAKLPELLERAHRGVPTVITKRGKPYAVLAPVTASRSARRGPTLLALRGSGSGLWGSNSTKALAKLREEWELSLIHI